MGCTPGSIAAEELWAPLSQGLDTPVSGLPSSVPANRNVPSLFRSGLGGRATRLLRTPGRRGQIVGRDVPYRPALCPAILCGTTGTHASHLH